MGAGRLPLTQFSRICLLPTASPGKGVPALGERRLRAWGAARPPRGPAAWCGPAPPTPGHSARPDARVGAAASRPLVKLPENIFQNSERHELICPGHRLPAPHAEAKHLSTSRGGKIAAAASQALKALGHPTPQEGGGYRQRLTGTCPPFTIQAAHHRRTPPCCGAMVSPTASGILGHRRGAAQGACAGAGARERVEVPPPPLPGRGLERAAGP